MADVDFYKQEVERQQAKNAEYQRVWLEAIGLLSALEPNTVIDATDVPGMARRIFDKVHALKNAQEGSANARMNAGCTKASDAKKSTANWPSTLKERSS